MLSKKAFTLLEVIIVLAMMGFIYTLGITSFSKKTAQKVDNYYSLKNVLIKYTSKGTNKHKNIELIALEDDNYILKIDGKITKNNLKFPKNFEVFIYGQDDIKIEEFEPYYKDGYYQDVLYRFFVYKNGSSSKAIVRVDENYYLQPNYFKLEPKHKITNDDIDVAKEMLLGLDIKNSLVEANE